MRGVACRAWEAVLLVGAKCAEARGCAQRSGRGGRQRSAFRLKFGQGVRAGMAVACAVRRGVCARFGGVCQALLGGPTWVTEKCAFFAQLRPYCHRRKYDKVRNVRFEYREVRRNGGDSNLWVARRGDCGKTYIQSVQSAWSHVGARQESGVAGANAALSG